MMPLVDSLASMISASSFDAFTTSVALGGVSPPSQTFAVGAPGVTLSSLVPPTRAVRVYNFVRRSPTSPDLKIRQSLLTAPPDTRNVGFGSTPAMSSSTLLVGAEPMIPPTEPTPADVAYVFTNEAASWRYTATLAPLSLSPSAHLG
jgi:hypothetical protein